MLYVYVGCAPWHVRGVVQGGAAQVEHGQLQQVTLQSKDTCQALQHSIEERVTLITSRNCRPGCLGAWGPSFQEAENGTFPSSLIIRSFLCPFLCPFL